MSRPPLLAIEDLSTHLGSDTTPVRAVDGVSLSIRRGETFVLLGESGCGKSMIALSIMRLLPHSGRIVAGDVLLDGQSLRALSEAEMRAERGGRIGMIFQEPMTSLNPVMTVGEQVAEAVRLHDPDSRGKVRSRVAELFRAVGIPDPQERLKAYPHQLSGGMKQRVMIAMALAGRPALLIADEPTTALDVTIQAQVLDLLRKLQQETDMAILLITHDLGVVAEMADRVGVMYAGQLLEISDVKSFFERPAHPYSRKLFRSVPDAAKRGHGLDVIPGIVPALDQPFNSCRFADRCELVHDACRSSLPPWRGAPQDGYRCHLTMEQMPDSAAAAVVGETAASQTADQLLQVEQLKVHFPIQAGILRRVVGYVKAVDGLDLAIPTGRTVALVGESGCGKTTVGKAILQLPGPTAGRVLFDGVDLASVKGRELRRLRREFQIIFQDPASSMNPRMLVEDIIAEGLVAQGLGGNRAQRRVLVEKLLDQVGMRPNAADRYPHEFSGGQRQRIAIARALALKPRLIVCDEPTSALDVSVQAQVLNLLKDLQAELGLSYLFITHNISVVAYLAHEVAVMYLGRIVEYGDVDSVLREPLHPYTAALLSAVPVADPAHHREVIRLEGDMPSPSDPPSGCHFHPRCPHASAICRERYPATVEVAPGRRVSCWLVGAQDR
ncbi:MAG: ABC transporter ATP-binding protein [Chromatiaceae bacterium]|nr:ABC transporter ATP-binding protein [Gammaproteobacteria bacterium]MCP5317195.1 ABC transporter ATP-binding protein [Chromatiaceae bacterium]MCP5438070.1 ABC transporter ATP-binding protein [Chromatiaceae bacterium]MCW5585458.1 ABC transporter ATP-binding protein [Chromatiales bacterium]